MAKWIAALTLPLAPLALWALSARAESHTLTDAALNERATHLFAFDHAHPGRVPAHHIRKLSLALEFHDHEGAQALIQQLEKNAGI